MPNQFNTIYAMKKKNYLDPRVDLKKVWLLASTLLFFSFILSAQNTTSGLIIHYSFDDVTETIVPDASGNNNIATLQGNATLVDGYTGKAVSMQTKQDFVRLPANFTVGLTSFSFAAWVKMDALRNATRFFDLGNGADGSNNFLVFIPSATGDNTSMRIRYRTSAGQGANVDVPTNIRIPINTWAHVAMTMDWNAGSNTATVVIYLNGNPVASVNNYPYNPSMLGNATADNYLGFSRWGQDTNGFSGAMDDVRFYNRALTPADVVALTGLNELNKQFTDLTLGDLSEVTEDLILPTVLGDNGVTATWRSSHPDIIDAATGKVTRPEKYDAYVVLTATLSLEVNGRVNTVDKSFTAKVLGMVELPELIAHWDFSTENIFVEDGNVKVKDAESEFVGTVMNEARIRTIGNTEQFNVLDLGNGTGFFDMGADIGEAIYVLNEYTISGYFHIDENYTQLTSNGNFYWTFSNTADAPNDRTGYIIGRLNNVSQEISSQWYAAGNQGLYTGSPATRGSWHHIAYTQTGTTGRIFIDGVQVASGSITNLPFQTLQREGRKGTIYNWLGRSNYPSDVYLRNTLLYGFQVFSVPLTQDNLLLDFEVPETLSRLNAAFAENPDFMSPTLQTEHDNLTMPDMSAVTTDITLPLAGTIDPNVKISWSSSHPQIIANDGKVTRPDYFDFEVTLRANLSLGSQIMVKEFPAKVLVKPGTEFQHDKIAQFDFSDVEGRIVYDIAEKRFQGTTVNDARIRPIGTTTSGRYNVLDLGNGTGYFDMGEEIGKALYHLEDYTMSAFYRIDPEYEGLTSNGNFLWTFSNTNDAMARPTGYIIGSLRNLSQSITPGFYTAASGNQAVAFGEPALSGGWHHLAYVQSGTMGTIYIDGMPMFTDQITNMPKSTLKRDGNLGTMFNWIGRSNYVSDVYLRQTLVYDFRLYKRALNDIEILATELDVFGKIEGLERAFAAAPDATSVENISGSRYDIIPIEGGIRLHGLTGNENVSIFDISGRRIQPGNLNQIKLNSGVYIIKIDNFTAKTLVR